MDNVEKQVALHLGDSQFLSLLSDHYALAPSAVVIRVAEAELLSALPMEPPILDLCCGDGYFCSFVRPNGVEVGCDMSLDSLRRARDSGKYGGIICADVAKGIPFRDSSFQTIFSNSSLEHVNNIDIALQEIARILRPGGRFYTTFASNFAYEWWPCGRKALARYLNYQPVFNYFPLEEWKRHMANAGLQIIGHEYYLSKAATRILMFLDYHFSHVYMTPDKTLARPVIGLMHKIPAIFWARLWSILFGKFRITVDDEGGSILIVAEREHIS